jgi:hypothetical protein
MATSIFRMGLRSLREDEDSVSLGNFANKFIQRKQETQPSPPVSPLILQPPKFESTPLVSTSSGDPPPPPEPIPRILPTEIIQVCRDGRPAEYTLYGGFERYLDE